jgi:hypothetical protein
LDENPKAKTTESEIRQHTERFTDPSKQSVSQKESNSGATAVAWCTCGSGQKKRKIYCYTSPTDANVVKYEMGSPTEISEDELEKLNGVSGTVNSVLDFRNEFGRRQYGYSNIKNILGVAMLSPDPNKKRFPTTTIFVEWQDILPDDLYLLITGQSTSWEMRSKLLRAAPKKRVDELNNWIIDTYTSQNESYAKQHNILPTPIPPAFRTKNVPIPSSCPRQKYLDSEELDPLVGRAEPQPEGDGAQAGEGLPKNKKMGRRDSNATEGQNASAKKLRAHQEATSQTVPQRKGGTLEDGEKEAEKKASKKRVRGNSDPVRDLESAKKCKKDSEAADQDGST